MPVWTRAGLRAVGVDGAALQRAVRGGDLARVGLDRYAAPGQADGDALVAAIGSGVALRGLSAARLWGLPAADGRIEAQVRNGCRRPALPRGVELRTVRNWHVVERDGIAVTDLPQTCVDVAREQPLEIAVSVLDAALRLGLEHGEVEELLGRGVAGAGRVRRAFALADGRAESPLESRLRLLLSLADLPPHDLQHRVLDRAGGFVGRVDLWYPQLVVEADGFEFHSRRDDFRKDLQKGVEYARLGLLVQRFSWDKVVGSPGWVVAAVGDATASALAEPQSRRGERPTRRPAGRTAGVGAA